MKNFVTALILSATLGVVGCAGSGSARTQPASTPAPTPVTPAAPTPDFTFTTGPSGSIEVVSSLSGTYNAVPVTLTVTGLNGLNNIVSVTTSALPSGITASAVTFVRGAAFGNHAYADSDVFHRR
jgi:hypothetical protein